MTTGACRKAYQCCAADAVAYHAYTAAYDIYR